MTDFINQRLKELMFGLDAMSLIVWGCLLLMGLQIYLALIDFDGISVICLSVNFFFLFYNSKLYYEKEYTEGDF